MSAQKKPVIYTRLSSDSQPPESHQGQERLLRDALTKIGIDAANVIVIHEEANPGSECPRPS